MIRFGIENVGYTVLDQDNTRDWGLGGGLNKTSSTHTQCLIKIFKIPSNKPECRKGTTTFPSRTFKKYFSKSVTFQNIRRHSRFGQRVARTPKLLCSFFPGWFSLQELQSLVQINSTFTTSEAQWPWAVTSPPPGVTYFFFPERMTLGAPEATWAGSIGTVDPRQREGKAQRPSGQGSGFRNRGPWPACRYVQPQLDLLLA